MRKLVRIWGLFVSLLFFAGIPAMVIHAEEPLKGSSDVVINSDNFPDDNFRSYISSEFDKDGDGIIRSSEIEDITEFMCIRSIKNMKGIEYFTALTELDCPGKQLTSLDVSKNTALTTLYCSDNQLTSLDVSKNTALTELDCSGNQLTSLDVSKNTALTTLYCSDNQLTSLDVSKNTALTTLYCSGNQLTSLDVSGATALTTLYCSKNQLTSLDVSGATALTTLDCYENQLTGLDVSGATALITLDCYDNQLTSLDVSKNTTLTSLKCYSNQLTGLDVSGATALTYLWCYSNQLTVLDVSGATALTILYCYENQLTDLDVSGATALTILYCYENQLTDLDVSGATALTTLYCYDNQLTDLDVSGATALTTLYCYDNQLTDLDVSKNKELRGLFCQNNQLKELDIQNNRYLKKGYLYASLEEYATIVHYKYVDYENESTYDLQCNSNVPIVMDVLINSSNFPDENFRSYVSTEFDKDGDGVIHSSEILRIKEIRCSYCDIKKMTGIEYFTALEKFYCYGNQLTRLNINKNRLLKYLYCGKNQLTSLDVSVNSELEDLRCYSNQLTSLDVSKNKALINLYCYDNQLTILDMSKNKALKCLDCRENKLKILDIQNNSYLKDAYKNGQRTIKNTTVKYELNQDNLLACDSNVQIITGEALEPLKITLSSAANGVMISWKEVNGASKYCVYKKNAKGNWTKLATVTTLKYTDTTVKVGETATYSVVGLTSAGKELNSIGNGTKISYKAPVTTPTAKYKETGTALSWSAVSGATKYRVFRKLGSGDWTKLTTTTSLSFVDKTAVYGKTYIYAVRAMNAKGSFISDMGKGTSFTYFAPTPKVTLSNGTLGVNISWKTVSGAAKYRIFVKNSSGAWAKLATIKEGTTYTDTKAKVGKNYTYAVVGMDTAGRLMNDFGTGTTINREKPVMSFTLKSVAAGVKASWKAADGAGKYRVYRKNSDGSWAMLATIKDGSLFYRDTTAEDGKTYTYAVVAMSAGGTALTDMGDGQKIKYVKPVSEVEVVEAEVTDVDGNVIVYTISDDEITEDFITIVSEDEEEASEDEDVISEEETSKDEAISEDAEETAEDEETIVEVKNEEISEDVEEVVSEDAISEDNEEGTEEVIAEETEIGSDETSEEVDEENAEIITETVNPEIEEEVQE